MRVISDQGWEMRDDLWDTELTHMIKHARIDLITQFYNAVNRKAQHIKL